MQKIIFISIFIFFVNFDLKCQSIPISFQLFDEIVRRNQLLSNDYDKSSLLVRPVNLESITSPSLFFCLGKLKLFQIDKNKTILKILPIHSTSQLSEVPYPHSSVFLQSKGFQTYLSSGVFAQIGPFTFQFQPELIYSQNKEYEIGVSKSWATEYLETFGEGRFRRVSSGQSSIKLNFGTFSAGVSTENIWWGPGQFNSLLFSNNAFGFEHLTLNTRIPAKTFIGSFEGQLIVGRLENSNLPTTNLPNQLDDWRYMNGITFSYQPKWVPGFFIGASRVFQQYNSFRGKSFGDYLPIFEPFQKERLIADAPDSGEYDRRGQDQQLTVFVRYFNTKAKTELYFEYGRRDHALNWREAILNPEHARAYLFGFKKLFEIHNGAHVQFRGEALQQQESINIVIRYPGAGGGSNWAGHSPILQGFTHRGQMLGPGVGPSSNVQTLEGAWVKGLSKLGLRLERLNRHQDFYQKSYLDPSEQGRWVDLSVRLLADWQFDNLIISSNINFVNSLNYQWQLAPNSTPEYPKGENLFSVHSQVSLIYLFQKKKESK